MRKVLSITIIQLLAVGSLQASELTVFSEAKLDGMCARKDYRGAVHYLITALSASKEDSLSRKQHLHDLAEVYAKAGASGRALELDRLRGNEENLRKFLQEEEQVTSPQIKLVESSNGDLVCSSTTPPAMQKRFNLLPTTSYIKKTSPAYAQLCKKYWWFKPANK